MSEALDDLLEEARQAGTVESAGAFTLDFQAAVAKLRTFQLENQYHYVNRLLRAAFLAQAGAVQVTANAQKTRVHFPAVTMPPSSLPQLFEDLFQRERPAARELATAVNVALALQPARLEVQITDENDGCMLLFQSGRAEVFHARGLTGTTFQLTRGLSGALSQWGAQTPEYMAIVKRFRFTPLVVSVNGQPLRGQDLWGAPRTTGRTSESINLKPGFFSLGRRFHSRHHAVEVRVYEDEGNCIRLDPSRASGLVKVGAENRTCWLALGLCVDPKRPSSASFVYQGEVLQSFPVQLPIPGVEFLVSAHGLPLDLSGEKLLEGPEFEERWEEAKRWFNMLHWALQSAYPGASGHDLTRRALFDDTRRWTSSLASGGLVGLQEVTLGQ